MKRVLLAAALCALALSGCDTLRCCVGMPTNDRPVVSVVGERISVDPEPLTFRRAQGAVVIVWKLDDASSSFRFTDNGIDVDDKTQFDCKIVGDGRQFMCLNKNLRTGKFKYLIRVRGTDGRVRELDPHIVNVA